MTDPAELLVRNLFTLQRAGSSVNDEVRARIHALFDEIASLVAKVDPGGPSLQRYRTERAKKLFDEIQSLTGETFDQIAKEVRVRLASIGQQQGDAATLHLQALLGTEGAGEVEAVKVTLNQMKAIVDSEPMQGALFRRWVENAGERTAFQVQRQVQIGAANAETIGQIVERVRGRLNGAGQYVGGVMQTTEREAETLVRTAVNHISTAATERTFRENRDILSGVEWVAALDGRTCLQCAPLDGKSWALEDTSRPRPPLHMNDRCVLVPVVDWKGLGVEPPPSGTRATARDPKTGKPGQVSSDLHYEQWLKAQPEAVQNDILGPGRAKLFREGRVSLSQLVRSDGARVPLDALGAVPHTAAPARLGLVREEARRAHEITFEGFDAAAPGQFETKMERLVATSRRGVRARLANVDGLDSLASALGFDPKRHLLRGQPLAEGQAAHVASSLAQHWDFLGPKDRLWFDALHLAARDEFGVEDAWDAHLGKGSAAKKAASLYDAHGGALRAYVRAQYEETQAYLKAHGVEHVTLFRGIIDTDMQASAAGTLRTWAEQPLASYSYNAQIAGRFAIGNGDGKVTRLPGRSGMVAVRVPAERVFSLSRTGPGKWNEGEFVLLGGRIEGVAVDVTERQAFLFSHAFDNANELTAWWWDLLEQGGFLAR